MHRFILKIHFIFLISFHLAGCISFTESVYNEENFEKFKSNYTPGKTVCQKDFLEYRLFQYFQKNKELECIIKTNEEDLKFQFVKADFYSSSFIAPLDELESYRLIPINFLAWLGLIPNYQERKVSIMVKVFSKKGILWEKEYYNYYEIWTSFLFLPIMPIQSYIFYKEDIPNQTLLATLESMAADFKLRGILD
jgi:hypothetical protein